MMNGLPLLDPVFLAQLDRLALVSRRLRAGRIQGERRSPNRGGSVEFADFRTYTPGDDFRQIDWNAYARLERLFLKLFVAEEDIVVHILLDSSASMAWGEPQKWQYARRLAAALGYVTLVGLDQVTAVALGNRSAPFPAARGKRQVLPWLTWLQQLEAGGAVAPLPAARAYLAQARRPGPLLLLSDLMGPDWEAAVAALAGQQYEVTVLHLLSPQEINPALDGDLQLVDSESASSVEITADFELLRRYRERYAAWQRGWQERCKALGSAYVIVDTSLSLDTLLLATLRRHGVLC
jgi:uncharacterized protein (DUF58 family)